MLIIFAAVARCYAGFDGYAVATPLRRCCAIDVAADDTNRDDETYRHNNERQRHFSRGWHSVVTAFSLLLY